jgi:nitrogen regulatory protein PII
MPDTSGLTAMTKLEIVATGPDVPAVVAVLGAAGVAGYTVLSGVSGMGHGGYHQGRLLFNDREGQRMVITVVPNDQADGILGAVRELFAERPGVVFVSEVFVTRPEYFS